MYLSDPTEIKGMYKYDIFKNKERTNKINQQFTFRSSVLTKPIASTGKNAFSAGFWIKDIQEKETILAFENSIRDNTDIDSLRSELKLGKFIWAKCEQVSNQIKTQFLDKMGELLTFADIPIRHPIEITIVMDSIWASKKTPKDLLYRWKLKKVKILK